LRSRVAQTRRVNEMLRDAANDVSLREALEALHLMPLVESLRETNDAFGATFLKRNDDWARKERPNSRVIRKSVDEAVKLLMDMLASFAELDGKSGYAEPIGELDRLLVYYRRTVAVRKGRRSAAKERAKSREHRSNADMQGGWEEQDIPDSREELDIQGKQGVWENEQGVWENERNERSEPGGQGNEQNNWGIQSKWSKPGIGDGMQDSRERQNTQKRGIILRMQEELDKQDVQDVEEGDRDERMYGRTNGASGTSETVGANGASKENGAKRVFRITNEAN
jgi:hypothetical protein